jgi:leucyl-tRNA synthetase
MPVDLYVGGAEHAVLHLLYARFWTKALADEGLLPFREPFAHLINQGQLHGPDGQRMSKSRGNVIIPDDVVAEYGADALRVYGLFMAPFEQNVDWNTEGINGARRFLNRVWSLVLEYYEDATENRGPGTAVDLELERARHRTIKNVTGRVETFRFNTMISALMEFTNLLYDRVKTGQWRTTTFRKSLETLLVLLAPPAPYITEELWIRTGHGFSIHQQSWPDYDEVLAQIQTVEIPVQINGKLRGTIQAETQTLEAEALKTVAETPEIQKHLEGRKITRVVYVPGKILNVVAR